MYNWKNPPALMVPVPPRTTQEERHRVHVEDCERRGHYWALDRGWGREPKSITCTHCGYKGMIGAWHYGS